MIYCKSKGLIALIRWNEFYYKAVFWETNIIELFLVLNHTYKSFKFCRILF